VELDGDEGVRRAVLVHIRQAFHAVDGDEERVVGPAHLVSIRVRVRVRVRVRLRLRLRLRVRVRVKVRPNPNQVRHEDERVVVLARLRLLLERVRRRLDCAANHRHRDAQRALG